MCRLSHDGSWLTRHSSARFGDLSSRKDSRPHYAFRRRLRATPFIARAWLRAAASAGGSRDVGPRLRLSQRLADDDELPGARILRTRRLRRVRGASRVSGCQAAPVHAKVSHGRVAGCFEPTRVQYGIYSWRGIMRALRFLAPLLVVAAL